MSHNGRFRIFIVDDTDTNIDVLMELLGEEYDVSVALDGESFLEDVTHTNPDLILLDIMMPGIDGYAVCEQLKRSPETRDIPVIFITAKQETDDETRGFAVGAVDYITKPFSPPVVLMRVNTHLQLVHARKQLATQNQILEQKVQERTLQLQEKNDELERTRLQIIRRLGRAAEFKDNETGLHVIRMSHYARLLAQAAGMGQEEAELLLQAAPMHDIGKIGIPDRILLKPMPLNEEEWTIMRRHPEIGGGIIGWHDTPLLQSARTVALTHHEKWDGTGYPNRLRGEEIPRVGRIVAIADVFDALTSNRPYKQAWSVERTVELLKTEAGKHFDPILIPVFINLMESILEIRNKWAETPESDENLDVR
ncbi:MAG: two-component system response regulator [Nitrospirae bacterium]|nr:two-component system response regulator [Magnetococcales bacterium]